MSDELPTFRDISLDEAREYIAQALSRANDPEDTFLRECISYGDHHFRAIFAMDYFHIAEGKTAPSKSQWNTLKKRMKRIRPDVFVFRDYGFLLDDENTTDETHCYLDFGFFVD